MTFKFPKEDVSKFVKESYKEMYNMPGLKKFSKHLPIHSSILDLGCGGGQDALFFAKHNHQVIGIDTTAEIIKIAKNKAKHPNITFKTSSFEKFSTKEKFDGIWCAKVFHFIPIKNQIAFIKKVYAHLKPGGIFYLTSKTSDKRKDYELPDGQNGSLRKRLTKKTFETILRKNGFRIIHFKYWKNKIGMEIIAKRN